MANKLVQTYLASYNFAQATGWAVALCLMLHNVATTGSVAGAYDVAGHIVNACQLASFLEVVHAATGLVKSGALNALVQWGGRSNVLFSVIGQNPSLQSHPAVFVLLAVWCLSEIIRYPQYGLSILGACPSALTWLRYSAFVVLYPVGMFGGEMVLIYLSIAIAKETKPFAQLFDHLPIDYHHVVAVILAAYPLFWLHLYTHMFHQRSAKLYGKKSAKAAKATSKKSHKVAAIAPMPLDDAATSAAATTVASSVKEAAAGGEKAKDAVSAVSSGVQLSGGSAAARLRPVRMAA